MNIDVSAVLAVVSALIAAGALILTIRQVQLASEQTELQRQLRIDAVQPYVWVDVRLHQQHGWTMMLVLKNEGPTVAETVTVTLEPPLPPEWRAGRPVGPATEDPEQPGLYRFEAIPPGREMQWTLGAHTEVLGESAPTRFAVTVDARGPYGAVGTLAYALELGDYRDAAITVPGTALTVAKAIKDSAELLNKTVQSASARMSSEGAEVESG